MKAERLEGLVAKRRDGRYEAGLRSGLLAEDASQSGAGIAIGGYTIGGTTFDALVFGYYEGDGLVYAARTRNGSRPWCGHS